MDRFALMSTFVRIVETGSLSATARQLRTTQPTVSKQLRALEELTHARLLERNTRALHLTEAGERYYAVCKRVLDELSEVETNLSGMRETVRGRLRLNLSVGLGEVHLSRIAIRFQKQNPEIVLDLQLTDRIVDLVEEGVDLAIRIGGVTDPNVVARPLGSLHYVLCATPEYLAAHGVPSRPEELSEHNYLHYRGDRVETLETPNGLVRVPVSSRFETNNSFTLRTAVMEGLGIGRCTRWIVNDLIEQGRLQVVLPGVAPPPLSVHAVYLANRHTPLKVRRFVEFLSEALDAIPGFNPARLNAVARQAS